MSISKAQAESIADGFLDNLGSGKEGLQPRETFSEIIVIAGELIEVAQDNLNRSNSNASGKLSESLVATDPILENGKLSVNIQMNYYGLFVNKGVKGTKSGSSKAGYAFKGDRPPQKMVDAIKEWSKRGKLSTSNTNPKKSISANEKKNASIGEIDKSYAVARSIMQHGIKPTGFLDLAIVTTVNKVRDRLGAALKIDIINSIS